MSLENFNWDDLNPEEDLFKAVGEPASDDSDDAGDSTQSDENDNDDNPGDKDPKDNQKNKGEDLFSKFPDPKEDDEDEDNDEPQNNQTSTPFVETLNTLKDSGVIEFELDEGEELDSEKVAEIIETNYQKRLEKQIEELPEQAKDLVDYLVKGGTLGEYMEAIAPLEGIHDKMDMDDEYNQELMVRATLEELGDDEETIDAQIEMYKDSGKLKMFADKYFEKWKVNDAKAKQKAKEDLIKRQEKLKKEIKEQKEAFKSILDKPEDLVLSVDPNQKNKLPSYISDKTVKLNTGASITQMQFDFYYELPKHKKAMAQMAILMNNIKEDGSFDFSSIERKAKTKQTREVKTNLRRQDSSLPNGSNVEAPKRLADLFSTKKPKN